MQPDERAAIAAIINELPIAATAYRTARRLLDRVGKDGHVKLTRSEMMAAAGTGKWNTARRHLSILQSLGVLHYSTNEDCYINFYRQPMIAERSQESSERSQRSSERSPDDDTMIAERSQRSSERSMIAQRSQHASERSQRSSERSSDAHPLVGMVGRLVGSNTDPTSQPTMDGDPPDPNDPAIRILMDGEIGISEKAAAEFAGVDPETVLKHAIAWKRDYEAEKVTGTGALLHRLRQQWDPPPLRKEDRRSEFYHRHHADPERHAYSSYVEPVQEPAEGEDAPLDVEDEPATAEERAWQQALDELEIQLPAANFDTWLRNARLVEAAGDTWRIGLPNAYARDWVESRLRNQIARTLRSLLQHDVTLEFITVKLEDGHAT